MSRYSVSFATFLLFYLIFQILCIVKSQSTGLRKNKPPFTSAKCNRGEVINEGGACQKCETGIVGAKHIIMGIIYCYQKRPATMLQDFISPLVTLQATCTMQRFGFNIPFLPVLLYIPLYSTLLVLHPHPRSTPSSLIPSSCPIPSLPILPHAA